MERGRPTVKFGGLISLRCEDGFLTGNGLPGERLYLQSPSLDAAADEALPFTQFSQSVFRIVPTRSSQLAAALLGRDGNSGGGGHQHHSVGHNNNNNKDASGRGDDAGEKITGHDCSDDDDDGDDDDDFHNPILSLNTAANEEITYGQAFSLRHATSGLYISINYTQPSANDPDCMSVVLVDRGAAVSRTCEFVLVSRYRIHADGDKVNRQDEVLIRQASNPVFLHVSAPRVLQTCTDAQEAQLCRRFRLATQLHRSKLHDGGGGGASQLQLLQRAHPPLLPGEEADPAEASAGAGDPLSLSRRHSSVAYAAYGGAGAAETAEDIAREVETAMLGEYLDEVNASEEGGVTFTLLRCDYGTDRANSERAHLRMAHPYVSCGVPVQIFHKERGAQLSTSTANARYAPLPDGSPAEPQKVQNRAYLLEGDDATARSMAAAAALPSAAGPAHAMTEAVALSAGHTDVWATDVAALGGAELPGTAAAAISLGLQQQQQRKQGGAAEAPAGGDAGFGGGGGASSERSSQRAAAAAAAAARRVNGLVECGDGTRLPYPVLACPSAAASAAADGSGDGEEHNCTTLWVFEEEDPTNMGPVRAGAAYRLRHVLTGHYLGVCGTAVDECFTPDGDAAEELESDGEYASEREARDGSDTGERNNNNNNNNNQQQNNTNDNDGDASADRMDDSLNPPQQKQRIALGITAAATAAYRETSLCLVPSIATYKDAQRTLFIVDYMFGSECHYLLEQECLTLRNALTGMYARTPTAVGGTNVRLTLEWQPSIADTLAAAYPADAPSAGRHGLFLHQQARSLLRYRDAMQELVRRRRRRRERLEAAVAAADRPGAEDNPAARAELAALRLAEGALATSEESGTADADELLLQRHAEGRQPLRLHRDYAHLRPLIAQCQRALAALIAFCTRSSDPSESILRRDGLPITAHQRTLYDAQLYRLIFDVLLAPLTVLAASAEMEEPDDDSGSDTSSDEEDEGEAQGGKGSNTNRNAGASKGKEKEKEPAKDRSGATSPGTATATAAAAAGERPRPLRYGMWDLDDMGTRLPALPLRDGLFPVSQLCRAVHEEIHLVCRLAVRLLRQMVVGNPRLAYGFSPYLPHFLSVDGNRLRVADTIREVLAGNLNVPLPAVRRLTHHYIECAERARRPMYLDILGALCTVHYSGIPERQRLVCRSLFVRRPNCLVRFTVRPRPRGAAAGLAEEEEGAGGGGAAEVCVVLGSGAADTVSLEEFFKSHPDRRLVRYVESQIALMARLCFDGCPRYCRRHISRWLDRAAMTLLLAYTAGGSGVARVGVPSALDPMRSNVLRLAMQLFVVDRIADPATQLRVNTTLFGSSALRENRDPRFLSGVADDDMTALLKRTCTDLLQSNPHMIVEDTQRNTLLRAAVSILRHLARFRQYTAAERDVLAPLLIELLDGSRDATVGNAFRKYQGVNYSMPAAADRHGRGARQSRLQSRKRVRTTPETLTIVRVREMICQTLYAFACNGISAAADEVICFLHKVYTGGRPPRPWNPRETADSLLQIGADAIMFVGDVTRAAAGKALEARRCCGLLRAGAAGTGAEEEDEAEEDDDNPRGSLLRSRRRAEGYAPLRDASSSGSGYDLTADDINRYLSFLEARVCAVFQPARLIPLLMDVARYNNAALTEHSMRLLVQLCVVKRSMAQIVLRVNALPSLEVIRSFDRVYEVAVAARRSYLRRPMKFNKGWSDAVRLVLSTLLDSFDSKPIDRADSFREIYSSFALQQQEAQALQRRRGSHHHRHHHSLQTPQQQQPLLGAASGSAAALPSGSSFGGSSSSASSGDGDSEDDYLGGSLTGSDGGGGRGGGAGGLTLQQRASSLWSKTIVAARMMMYSNTVKRRRRALGLSATSTVPMHLVIRAELMAHWGVHETLLHMLPAIPPSDGTYRRTIKFFYFFTQSPSNAKLLRRHVRVFLEALDRSEESSAMTLLIVIAILSTMPDIDEFLTPAFLRGVTARINRETNTRMPDCELVELLSTRIFSKTSLSVVSRRRMLLTLRESRTLHCLSRPRPQPSPEETRFTSGLINLVCNVCASHVTVLSLAQTLLPASLLCRVILLQRQHDPVPPSLVPAASSSGLHTSSSAYSGTMTPDTPHEPTTPLAATAAAGVARAAMPGVAASPELQLRRARDGFKLTNPYLRALVVLHFIAVDESAADQHRKRADWMGSRSWWSIVQLITGVYQRAADMASGAAVAQGDAPGGSPAAASASGLVPSQPPRHPAREAPSPAGSVASGRHGGNSSTATTASAAAASASRARRQLSVERGLQVMRELRAFFFTTSPTCLSAFFTNLFDAALYFKMEQGVIKGRLEALLAAVAAFAAVVAEHTDALGITIEEVVNVRRLLGTLQLRARALGLPPLEPHIAACEAAKTRLREWLVGQQTLIHERLARLHAERVRTGAEDMNEDDKSAFDILLKEETVLAALSHVDDSAAGMYLTSPAVDAGALRGIQEGLCAVLRGNSIVPSLQRGPSAVSLLASRHLMTSVVDGNLRDALASVLRGMTARLFTPRTFVGLLNLLTNALCLALAREEWEAKGFVFPPEVLAENNAARARAAPGVFDLADADENPDASVPTDSLGYRLQVTLDSIGTTVVVVGRCAADDDVVAQNALRLCIALLEGGNRRVQRRLLRAFAAHEEPFFNNIKEILRRNLAWVQALNAEHEFSLLKRGLRGNASASAQRTANLQFMRALVPQSRRARREGGSGGGGGRRRLRLDGWGRVMGARRIRVVTHIFRLLQLFCEGHVLGMQDYTREQFDNFHSANLVHEALVFIDEASVFVTPSNVEMLTQGFDLLTELCQGPCTGNQACLVAANACHTIRRVLEHLQAPPGLTGVPSSPASAPSSPLSLTAAAATVAAGLTGRGGANASAAGAAGNVASAVAALNHVSSAQVSALRRSMATTLLSLTEGCEDAAVFAKLLAQMPVATLEAEVCLVRPSEYHRIVRGPEDGTDAAAEALFNWLIVLTSWQPFATPPVQRHIASVLARCAPVTRYLGSIEIRRDYGLERVYFRIPQMCDSLTSDRRDELLWAIDRTSRATKLADFLHTSDELIFDIEQSHRFKTRVDRWTRFDVDDEEEEDEEEEEGGEEGEGEKGEARNSSGSGGTAGGGGGGGGASNRYYGIEGGRDGGSAVPPQDSGRRHHRHRRSCCRRATRGLKLLYNHYIAPFIVPYDVAYYETVSMLVAVITNVILLAVEGRLTSARERNVELVVLRALCTLQVLVCAAMLFMDVTVSFPVRLYRIVKERQRVAGEKARLNIGMDAVYAALRPAERLRAFLTFFIAQFRIFLLTFALLSLFATPYFAAFNVMLLIYKISTLRTFITAITHNGKQLLLTALLGIILLYLFSIIGFLFFPNAYDADADETADPNARTNCRSLLECFTFISNYGLRAGGGIGDEMQPWQWGQPDLLGRFAYDMLFYSFVTVVFLNIMFGIIIDTFGEMRDDKREREQDMHGCCLICGLDADVLERIGPAGFQQHVRREHNMWMYLYFVHHLRCKDPSDYTGQESYVNGKIHQGRLDFFPNEECLSLRGAQAAEAAAAAAASASGAAGNSGGDDSGADSDDDANNNNSSNSTNNRSKGGKYEDAANNNNNNNTGKGAAEAGELAAQLKLLLAEMQEGTSQLKALLQTGELAARAARAAAATAGGSGSLHSINNTNGSSNHGGGGSQHSRTRGGGGAASGTQRQQRRRGNSHFNDNNNNNNADSQQGGRVSPTDTQPPARLPRSPTE